MRQKLLIYGGQSRGKSLARQIMIAWAKARGMEVVEAEPPKRIQGVSYSFVSYEESWVYQKFMEGEKNDE